MCIILCQMSQFEDVQHGGGLQDWRIEVPLEFGDPFNIWFRIESLGHCRLCTLRRYFPHAAAWECSFIFFAMTFFPCVFFSAPRPNAVRSVTAASGACMGNKSCCGLIQHLTGQKIFLTYWKSSNLDPQRLEVMTRP